MKTETPIEQKQEGLFEKADQSCEIACRVLRESGLLTGLSEMDVSRILTNLTYELIPFKRDEQLISKNQFVTSFLILHEGSVKIASSGTGQMMPCEDRIIGLEIWAAEKKTSYMDVYAATDGLAVKYHFQKLLDTKGIFPVSKVRLMTNMIQYTADRGIRLFHVMSSLKKEPLEGYEEYLENHCES